MSSEILFLVYSDRAVNPSDVHIRCEETDGAEEQEVDERDEEEIAEEENFVGQPWQFHTRAPEEDAVSKEPEGGSPTDEERPPVPAIVLGRQRKVTEQNRHSRCGLKGSQRKSLSVSHRNWERCECQCSPEQ